MCESAIAVFERVKQYQMQQLGVEWSLRKIDISGDEKLFDLYGIKIPVLCIQGSDKDLGWPFDEQELNEYLVDHLRNELK